MYPRGSYKGMGDIPFIDAFTAVDVANIAASYNPYASALSASGIAANYDGNGVSSYGKSVTSVTGTPKAFDINSYVMTHQGLLAAVVVGVIAFAALKR